MKFLLSLLAVLAIASHVSAGWKEALMIMVNTYRQIGNAPALEWDDNLVPAALAQSINCSLVYDYWADNGQIIFNIAQEGGGKPDLGTSSIFAADHWYDLRHNYHPSQDQYDELAPFAGSWEYTAMVWKSSKKIGCAWSTVMCPIDDWEPEDVKQKAKSGGVQLVCLMHPPPNRWDQFGANVYCWDCNAPQQTATINPATIKWDTKRGEIAAPTGESTAQPTEAVVKRKLSAAEVAQAAHQDATPENKDWWLAEAERIRAEHGMAGMEQIQ